MCHRYLNNHEEALVYYKEAEKLEPENLYIQAYIGHTLMRLEKYEEALKYYFKVEYLAPSNDKIQHPIAWVSFVLGKFDTAVKYFLKIPEKDRTKQDYIHLGNIYWCLNDMSKTKEYYKAALGAFDNDFTKFVTVFNEDLYLLQKHGISNLDISLMKDFILNSKS